MNEKFPYGLFAVRHCLTQNNAECRITGQKDRIILSRSTDVSGMDKHIVDQRGLLILTSPTCRCVETARLIERHFSGSITFRTDDRLMERGMGIWEGMLKADVLDNSSFRLSEGHLNPERTPPGGEPLEACIQRIDQFIADLMLLPSDQPILISGHNQTLKLLKYRLYGLSNLLEYWVSASFSNGKVTRIF